MNHSPSFRVPLLNSLPHEPLIIYSSNPRCTVHNVLMNFSKGNRLEVAELVGSKLKTILCIPINGRIVIVRKIRPPLCDADLLFVSTEKYHFCILQYNQAKHQVETIANGSLMDKCCRPAEHGQMVSVDKEGRLLVIHAFQGLIKVLPVDLKKCTSGNIKFKDPFNIRIDELMVQSIDFVLDNDDERPLISILHQTVGFQQEVKSYYMEQDKKLKPGPYCSDVDQLSYKLVAVPRLRGGLLIFSSKMIQYYNEGKNIKTGVSFTGVSRITAVTRIDEDGFRYLIGDHKGRVMVLILQVDSAQNVTGLKLERLGRTSPVSCLAYLDSGLVFVGSTLGPNQIIQLSSKRFDNGTFVDIIESEDTHTPILDMSVVDLYGTGQNTIVACTGAFGEGGLSIIRRGIGAELNSSVSFADIMSDCPYTGMWPLDLTGTGKADHLAFSTPFGTDLLKIDLENGYIELVTGTKVILPTSSSLYIGQSGYIVYQVSSSSINYKSCLSGSTRKIWMPQNNLNIMQATSLGNHLLIGLSNNYVVLFDVTQSELVQRKTVLLPNLPSCLSIALINKKVYGFVGLWSSEAGLIDFSCELPVFQKLASLNQVPHSIAALTDTTQTFLFTALPSGIINYGQFNGASLEQVHEYIAGSTPAVLHLIDNGIFVQSNRPSFISMNNCRPQFLSVPLKDISLWTMMKLHAGIPSSFAAVGLDGVVYFGSLDMASMTSSSSKLHLTRVKIGETCRKIASVPDHNLFAVLSIKADEEEYESFTIKDISSLFIIDDQSFEVVDRYSFPQHELVQSLLVVKPDALESIILVGTSNVSEGDTTPTNSKGKILTFKVLNEFENGRSVRRISLVTSLSVQGNVLSMAWIRERLVATVGGSTSLFQWSSVNSNWEQLSCHYGQVIGVHLDVLDDCVAVADMMRSASLLTLAPGNNQLTEVARDYYTGWATVSKLVDKDHILLADDHGNLSQLITATDANFINQRLILNQCDAIHLGSIINTLIEGSLSDHMSSLVEKTFIFGCASGALCTLTVLREHMGPLLRALNTNIKAVSRLPGAIPHSDWRSFWNEKRTLQPNDRFIDGDLIQRFLKLPSDVQKVVLAGGVVPGAGPLSCAALPGKAKLNDIIDLVDQLSCL